MSARHRWRPESARARVYAAIKSAGEAGLARRELLQALEDLGASHIDALTTELRQRGYVLKTEFGANAVTSGCTPAPIFGSELEPLLELVSDYPGGIGDALMQELMGMSEQQLRPALQIAKSRRQLVRITLPASHGGGLGWKLAPEAQPNVSSAQATPAQMTATLVICGGGDAERDGVMLSGPIRLVLSKTQAAELLSQLRA